MNAIAQESDDVAVLYLARRSNVHGWGDLVVSHPHRYVDDTLRDGLVVAAYGLTSRSLRVIAPFGYRGPTRVGLLLAAHLRRTKVTTRSDSNIQQVERDSTFARRVRQMLMRAAFPRATRVWTVGEKNQEYWNKYLRRKNTRLIPYSTPELPNSTGSPPQPRRSDPNAMNFLFVGRLDPVKNIETVILAFLSIDATISKEWSFTIVGDGPSRGALQELAVGDPRIHFTGAIAYPELDRYYLPADVVLLPSLAEPWGLVVNEGLAFGSRVLISDQVGASELLVGHPERGSVLQARDVGAWQEAMTQSVDYLDRVPVPPYDPTQDMLDDLRALGGVR